MVFFYVVVIILVLQRFVELIIAKRNEKWILEKGGKEFGREHYPLMVLHHTLFFLTLLIESFVKGYPLSPLWPIILVFLLLTQLLRYWAIQSLGPYWNTRIMVLPGAEPVVKGPYKYFCHPNYLAVILEFVLIPLLFNAFLTCILFSILNALLLKYRISLEEKALIETTEYQETMSRKSRFLPGFWK